MNDLPDYSESWLKELNDEEIEHWHQKPQSEKDWWALNTKPSERASILRTEISAAEIHKKLLKLPKAKREAHLDKLKRNAEAALVRIKSRTSDDNDA